MSVPAVPKPGSKPPGPVAPEPPRSNVRRLGAFPWLVLGGAVGAAGLLALILLALDAKTNTRPNARSSVRAKEAPAPNAIRESPRVEPAVPRETPAALEPRHVVPAAVRSDARSPEQPAEWPPARAFTARCKAPGGGCVEECTTLAGGRCLDPCFIHTADCSSDCKKPDGTCGWPPPDSE